MKRPNSSTFQKIMLPDARRLFVGMLPKELLASVQLEKFWNMRPGLPEEILLHGRMVCTPRWEAAMGNNYAFFGYVSATARMPESMAQLFDWLQATVDRRLDGMLVEWCNAAHSDFRGRGHFGTQGLQRGAPIVMISLGPERMFRLERSDTQERHEFCATDGSVFILPRDTNLHWMHQVCPLAANSGQLISLTVRAHRQR